MSETATITPPPSPEATAQTPPPPAPDTTAQQSSTTEQQVPPAAPQQPEDTARAEQERNVEIRLGRQEDATRISNVIFKRKLQAEESRFKKATQEERADMFAQDPVLNDLKTIDVLSNVQDTRTQKVDERGEPIPLYNESDLGDTEIKFTRTNPTTGQEESVVVNKILSVEGDNFYVEATVNGVSGVRLDTPVERRAITIATINSLLPKIIDEVNPDGQPLFSQNEHDLLEIYLKQTTNPNILMEADSRAIMERVATDIGLLQVDDLQAMVNKGMENIDMSDQHTGLERKKQLDALQDILDADRVLATADTVEKALTLMGSGKKEYTAEKDRLTAEKSRLIAEKSAYLDKNSKDADIQKHIEDLTKQIEDNESQLDVVERVLSVVDNHEAIAQLAAAVTDGNTLQEVAVSMVDAIRNNDWDKMLEAHPDLREDPNDTPEMRRKKQALREQYKKMGKMGGLGLLFLLSLLAEVMPEAMK